MTGIIKRLFSKQQKKQPLPAANGIGFKEGTSENITTKKRILERSQHNISRKKISHNALKVLYRLNEAGFQSYLVGGGVRDILLGMQPKDFDIATDATPEEIDKLFSNCRLIGKRFRLAHILFGREIIEVATFRAGHDEQLKPSISADQNNDKSKNDLARTSDHGMLVRDNVYGTLCEDAFRRDFTVNALYYTVKGFDVIDYTDGLEDLAQRKLRLIGDPDARYREDPVRILRAIRLACKLDLTIEPKTATPIKALASLLTHVSSARLWDECNKMFLAGHALNTWNALRDKNVATYLFPQTISSLNDNLEKSANKSLTTEFANFISAALKSTDDRISNQQPVTPAFLFAVFLWKPVQDLTLKLLSKGMSRYEAGQKAAAKVMDTQRQSIAIPKRFSIVAKEVWTLQFRLTNLRKKSVLSLIKHPRFRAAYDFLCLRAGDDEELAQLAGWWTDYQNGNLEQRTQQLNSSSQLLKRKSNPGKKSKNTKRNKNAY